MFKVGSEHSRAGLGGRGASVRVPRDIRGLLIRWLVLLSIGRFGASLIGFLLSTFVIRDCIELKHSELDLQLEGIPRAVLTIGLPCGREG